MARLQIRWRTMTSVAPQAVVTGKSAEETANRAARAERPLMVYIPSDDPTDSTTRKLEDVVFANEKFALGTKFFDTVKVTAGNAATDRILKETGDVKDTPRIVFVTRDWEVKDIETGRSISAGKLIRSMSKLVRTEYEENFDRMVRDYTKLLNDLDRLEGKKDKLAADRARYSEGHNPSKMRRLEREEEELRKEMDEWAKKEKELLSFELKGEEKPDA